MYELTTQQVSALVDLLNVQQQAVESMAHDRTALLPDSSQPGGFTPAGDPADLADFELMRAQANASLGRDVRELRRIQDARVRIGAGGMGICIECGEEIGFDRLQVLPTAARCVHCQDVHEHAHMFRPNTTSGGSKRR